MTNQAQGKPWEGHTPLPWKARTDDFDCAILTHDGYTLIAETSDNEARDKANAALIVERVNKGPAADAMAEALEAVLPYTEAERLAEAQLVRLGKADRVPIQRAIEIARKALAAYRGEQP